VRRNTARSGVAVWPLRENKTRLKSPNGHIHQLAQKVQGNMTFHVALSRAFRRPARGSGSLSGPMLVPADELRSKLWLYTVTIMQRNKPLAVADKTLAG
jgi:3',5'-cyclic-AMP phosphodiesterase